MIHNDIRAARAAVLVAALALALAACSSDDDGGGPSVGGGGGAGDGGAEQGAGDLGPGGTAGENGAERVTGENYRAIDCGELSDPALLSEEIGAFVGADGTRVECALVTVPADWSIPDGETLELALYRVPSVATDPAPDPVIYLEGGPGGAGVATLPEFVGGSAAYLRERGDVIVLDQRGTGYSRPALYCSEAFVAESEGGDLRTALEACRDRLVTDGVDFSDYTSANNARDVEAVREALGYPSWNLYGLSYGTRLALTAMRDAPGAIRSTVLDSVFPPEINGIAESAYPYFWAIEQIGINCAADASCAAEHDDIRTSIDQGIARLEANPIAGLGAEDYVELLGRMTAEPALAALIAAVAGGEEAEVAALLAELDGAEAEAGGEGGEGLPDLAEVSPVLYPFLADSAQGMYAAVVCAEELPFPDDLASPDIAGEFPETTRRVVESAGVDESIAALCSVFEVPATDAIEVEVVRAETPTLVLAGTADMQTPPTWSMLASEALPNATYAEFAGLGHGVLGENECVNRITRAFLDAPDTTVDQSCIADLPGVDYD